MAGRFARVLGSLFGVVGPIVVSCEIASLLARNWLLIEFLLLFKTLMTFGHQHKMLITQPKSQFKKGLAEKGLNKQRKGMQFHKFIFTD